MRASRTALFAAPLLLLLSGCGYVHFGPLPEAPAATPTGGGDEKLRQENADLRLEKKMLQQELALSRAQGDALRTAIENRAADGDTSRRLVEKLNDTSRELAELRTRYAQLQSARPPAAGEGDGALRARLGETEEKLAATLRSFTELQAEIGRLRTEIAEVRSENVTLAQQLQSTAAQNAEARAALAQLNTELLAQRDARQRAEQDVETLRAELKATPAAPGAAAGSSALGLQRAGTAGEARALTTETAVLQQQLDAAHAKAAALEQERTQLQRQLATAAQSDAAMVPQPIAAMAATAPGANDVPLPRPRPGDPDAPTGAPEAAPVAAAAPAPTRVVRVGDKLVRLVGPETPYAPQTVDPG